MGKFIIYTNDECLREVAACESDFIQNVSLLNLLIIFLQPLTLISGEDESYFHPHICNTSNQSKMEKIKC